MLKKLIAYQRLLLNSMSPIEGKGQNSIKGLLNILFVFIFVFVTISIFMGNSISSNEIGPFILSVASVWMINRILNNSHRMFETVPVSRKYTVFNIFLLSIVNVLIAFVILWVFMLVLIGSIVGIGYLVFPQGFSQSPPDTIVYQIVDTTKGSILMLFIAMIILFAGTAITFIRSQKLRNCSFAGFTIIGYGCLFVLKGYMPIAPNSTRVEFLQSFSIMPQANAILICTAVTTVVICIASVFMGYKLYVINPKGSKQINK